MKIKNLGVVFTLVFNPDADVVMNFPAKYDLTFNQVLIVNNITELSIYVNNNLVSSALTLSQPIIVKANDDISVVVSRDSTQISRLELLGNTI